MKAVDLEVGQHISRGPYLGKVDRVRRCGSEVGGGNYLSFRIRSRGWDGEWLPYTDAMGPVHADEEIAVVPC